MTRKQKILDDITRTGFPEKEVVLTLDEFFGGNDNFGTIGANIFTNQPHPQRFYAIFKKLIEDNDAYNVLVRVADADDPEEWFYTDAVYIVGIRIDAAQLAEKVKELQPDEIYPGWMYGTPVNLPAGIDPEAGVVSLWWD